MNGATADPSVRRISATRPRNCRSHSTLSASTGCGNAWNSRRPSASSVRPTLTRQSPSAARPRISMKMSSASVSELLLADQLAHAFEKATGLYTSL